MTKMNSIRAVALAALLTALPVGLMAQTQTYNSQDNVGAATTASPEVMAPSAPVAANSEDFVGSSEQQINPTPALNDSKASWTFSGQPDYSKNPYWAPLDQSYISNQTGG